VRARLGLVLVVGLVACNDKSTVVSDLAPVVDGEAPSDLAIAVPDANARFYSVAELKACGAATDADCARLLACDPTGLRARFGELGGCNDRMLPVCLRRLSAPSSGVTVAGLHDCAVDLAALGCGDYFNGNTPASCRPVGLLSVGLACGDGTQCKTGFCYRANPDVSLCGTCGLARVVGATCGATQPTGYQCGPGLTCGGGACVTPAVPGGDCTQRACGANLSCVSGACVAPGGIGDACQMGMRMCDLTRGLVCNLDTDRCAVAQMVDVGADCTGARVCGPDGYCNQGTCVPRVEDERACLKSGAPCRAPYLCVGNVCTLPDPLSCS
jgi:hypothetical protein